MLMSRFTGLHAHVALTGTAKKLEPRETPRRSIGATRAVAWNVAFYYSLNMREVRKASVLVQLFAGVTGCGQVAGIFGTFVKVGLQFSFS